MEFKGFHWDNSQCTRQSFVLYKSSGHKSYCAMYNSLRHDTAAVAKFKAVLILYVKNEHSGLKKNILTDWAASQYKNK